MPLVAHAEALFDRVLAAFAAAGALLVAAMALSITINVVLRNAGAPTLLGLLDLIEYGLLAVTFLAAPWVLAKNAHVAVDLIPSILPPRAARVLVRVVACIGFAVSAVLLRYSAEAMLASAARGSMIRQAFVFPEWWVLAIMPLGLALICLEFLRQIARPPAAERPATGL